MRILHVITSLYTGGAEKLMTDLLPRLKEKGIEVELCVFNGTVTPFYEQLKNDGITIHSFGNGSVYNPLHIFKLIHLIKKGNFDIIHTHNTASQLFGAIASLFTNKKICTTEHNTSNRRRNWRLYRSVDRMMYNRYDHIICISPETKINLLNSLSRISCPISIIYNGVALNKFNIQSDNILPKKNSYKTIIQVAGFRPQKDQDTTIKALKYLSDKYHLYLVGDGIRHNDLKNLVETLSLNKRVHFLGIRNDIPQLISYADFVVMSSHWEGFGLAAVEGMAAGKPVIASDVDGLREVVAGAGVLFESGNEKDLAEKIMQLDSNSKLYESISKKCIERAKEFDISKMVDGYMQIYTLIENI